MHIGLRLFGLSVLELDMSTDDVPDDVWEYDDYEAGQGVVDSHVLAGHEPADDVVYHPGVGFDTLPLPSKRLTS